MTTRSQAADLACSARLHSLLHEMRSLQGRLWADRFISKHERGVMDAFVREAEEAVGRLALRVSGNSETGLSAALAKRPSSKLVEAAE